MKLCIVADLHIHEKAKDNRVVASRLKAIWEYMAKDKKCVLVISGDITDDGSVKQYRQAHKLLKPFAGRVLMVPGNHDMGYLGNFYDRECEIRYRILQSSLTIPGKQTLGAERTMLLDTTLDTGGVTDFAQGEVLKIDINRILRIPRTSDTKSGFIAVMHHTPLHQDWFLRLNNAKEFLNAALGRLDLIICGHDHGERIHNYPDDPKKPVRTKIIQAGALYRDDVQPIWIDV